MHLEIIDKKRIDLLTTLKKISNIDEFYIGGGTGLSLQLGLRISEDFDFFNDKHFDTNSLLKELKNNFKNGVEIINQEETHSTLNLFINKIKVSFIEYNHKNLKPYINFNEFKPMKLASLEDIACMKSIAIIQRGTKKDFFDLYFLIKKLKLNALSILKLLNKKYHDKNLILNFMYSLSYFDDAENDILPKVLITYTWEEIKGYFLLLQREIKKYYINKKGSNF
ncbi:MAG: nucleotidyl transferase AbiEii/AbiGii toxin family protein [Bacilli bacterium]|nr:nucleotidyl transferase AbiEii/AbiGii toxin family protein [Bacilli bacterium]